jgi:hypothetical protein
MISHKGIKKKIKKNEELFRQYNLTRVKSVSNQKLIN